MFRLRDAFRGGRSKFPLGNARIGKRESHPESVKYCRYITMHYVGVAQRLSSLRHAIVTKNQRLAMPPRRFGPSACQRFYLPSTTIVTLACCGRACFIQRLSRAADAVSASPGTVMCIVHFDMGFPMPGELCLGGTGVLGSGFGRGDAASERLKTGLRQKED
jgi:hypothetical protein